MFRTCCTVVRRVTLAGTPTATDPAGCSALCLLELYYAKR